MKTISIHEATNMYDEFLDRDYEKCPEAWMNTRISTAMKVVSMDDYKKGLCDFLCDNNLSLEEDKS